MLHLHHINNHSPTYLPFCRHPHKRTNKHSCHKVVLYPYNYLCVSALCDCVQQITTNVPPMLACYSLLRHKSAHAIKTHKKEQQPRKLVVDIILRSVLKAVSFKNFQQLYGYKLRSGMVELLTHATIYFLNQHQEEKMAIHCLG